VPPPDRVLAFSAAMTSRRRNANGSKIPARHWPGILANVQSLRRRRGALQMTERPLIFVVDDESEALAGMLDALTRRFGGDYRVVPHLSAGAALDAVRKSAKDGDEIALVIADQRMPEMTGREFLGRVRSIVPTAKRALVVAWGDREASPTILQAC